MNNVKDLIKIALTTNRITIKNASKRKRAFDKAEKNDVDNIPVFIINFNRLECLRVLITRLEELGTKNINIIDNASTYGPLLKYYDSIPYKVFKLKKNWGFKVFWECPDFEQFRQSFYILTDSDVIPLEDCPKDYKRRLFDILRKYPRLRKAGLSLKIDDLPANGIFTKEVQRWEKQFYRLFLPHDNCYLANIDTTFAMYAPSDIVSGTRSYSSVRTGYPLQARHMPWYKMKDDISEEDIYYSQHKTNGWWDANIGTATPDTLAEQEEFIKVVKKNKKGHKK